MARGFIGGIIYNRILVERVRSYTNWTGLDKKFILDNIDLTDREIALALNRTMQNVDAFRKRQGIKKAKGFKATKGGLRVTENGYVDITK